MSSPDLHDRAIGDVRTPRGIALGDVAAALEGARLSGPAAGVMVRGVHHDSRAIEPGDLFVARAGTHADGRGFIGQAIDRGAVAVLVGGDVEVARAVPTIRVDDVPRALALASDVVYGRPFDGLQVVGITGTNGKTTTAELVRTVIDASGARAGVIGTLGHRFESLDVRSGFTSPEADELARVARAMSLRGASHLVMEVSSIALAAARADAVRFRVAAFTNLTQDHLDYHGTMQGYAEAKARLFTELRSDAAAINVDDPFGAELCARVGSRRLARFSVEPSAGAELRVRSLSHTAEGIDMLVRTPTGDHRVRSPMLGLHNVANLLTAMSIAWLLDLDLAVAAEALSAPVVVPGRLERCDTPGLDDITVLVDYAHTPDALSRVLESVRELRASRVVCVFGCGGDRDASKRPRMGEAVGKIADFALITNDNPRSEDPRLIADAIVRGIEPTGASFEVELDRHVAIDRVIREASPGEVILIAGKGHEPYQIIGGKTLAFDDRLEARRALEQRRIARRSTASSHRGEES